MLLIRQNDGKKLDVLPGNHFSMEFKVSDKSNSNKSAKIIIDISANSDFSS